MNTILLFGMPGTREWTIIIISVLATAIALFDIILVKKFKNFDNKILWALAVIFLPPLGTLLYFYFGRTQKFA